MGWLRVERSGNVKIVEKLGKMLKKFGLAAALAAGIMAVAGTASASTIVFTTSGANSVSGKATFNFSASSFTVTLENLTSPMGMTDQELDGLLFKLSTAGTPTLTSVTAAGILDCSGDHSVPCAPYAGVVAANDGWGLIPAAPGVTDLTTIPLGFHPYAIINSNYTLPGQGNGNLANPEHNPFLVGPVVFTFTGAFTGVSDVQFDWGTQPYVTNGTCASGCQPTGDTSPVPEPTSVLLLGSGLVYCARRLRRG